MDAGALAGSAWCLPNIHLEISNDNVSSFHFWGDPALLRPVVHLSMSDICSNALGACYSATVLACLNNWQPPIATISRCLLYAKLACGGKAPSPFTSLQYLILGSITRSTRMPKRLCPGLVMVDYVIECPRLRVEATGLTDQKDPRADSKRRLITAYAGIWRGLWLWVGESLR